MRILLAWQQLRSQWHSGEVRVLFLALVLAVAATTSVGFFTDRIQSALIRQGGLLLGADLVVSADHALPAHFAEEAGRLKLATATTIEFPSMAIHNDLSQLAEIKAVSERFPLRGELTIADAVTGPGRAAHGVPQPGSAWVEARLANLLSLKVGDEVEVGDRRLRVSRILQREPSRGGDMFSIAPRLMMNVADVESTGLIQFGSRIKYQLLLASDARQIERYGNWAKSRVARGEKVEDVRSARPEMKSALDKAQQFLGLSAMVSVILAMVAMYLASLPYVQRSLDSYALMRCFGASKSDITRILLNQTLFLGVIGSALGCVLGFAAQAGLAALVGSLFVETLPAAGWAPVLAGFITGLATMLSVVWPQLTRLRDVPALRILRRDLGDRNLLGWLGYAPSVAILAGLVMWHAQSIKLGSVTLAAFFSLLLIIGLIAIACGKLMYRVVGEGNGAWKLGLASLRRRSTMTVAQVAGFSLGLMALILLALVRNDLLQNWQASLPEDAPNRFIINIQPDQIEGIKTFFAESGLHDAGVHPMVKGRLMEVNGEPMVTSKYTDEQSRRLAEREFNLSWAADMQVDNELVAGRWWTVAEHGQPLISLEEGLAKKLGLKVGDKLVYDIAGTRIDLKVSSLRKVDWDTMRANFFAVTPPGVLDSFAASYITSFHLPLGQDVTLNQLVKRYTNLTVLDIAELMMQVRGIMHKMTYAIEYVFSFSLIAGLAVLYAALVATREERIREVTLLRVLGASRRQVLASMLTEFAAIGGLAAIIATLVASGLAYYVSAYLLDIPYRFNPQLALWALIGAAVIVPFAAWLGLRGFLNRPPRTLLHSV
jgi:putative ABC transport system permease protein